MRVYRDLRTFLRVCYDTGAWRPANAEALLRGVLGRRRNEIAGFTDDQHLATAARWLANAQDASTNGGVVGRYRLKRGWTSSHPKTTGHIIPTLLDLAAVTGQDEWKTRADRAVEFPLGVQLPMGAFPVSRSRRIEPGRRF